MRLIGSQGKITKEATECAKILNKYFHNQFWKEQLLSNTLQLETTAAASIEITTESLIKLI